MRMPLCVCETTICETITRSPLTVSQAKAGAADGLGNTAAKLGRPHAPGEKGTLAPMDKAPNPKHGSSQPEALLLVGDETGQTQPFKVNFNSVVTSSPEGYDVREVSPDVREST